MLKVIGFIDLETGVHYNSKADYIAAKKAEIWDNAEPNHLFPSTDSYSDYDLEREYFEEADDRCPHCGSYEGRAVECPECGHGQ